MHPHCNSLILNWVWPLEQSLVKRPLVPCCAILFMFPVTGVKGQIGTWQPIFPALDNSNLCFMEFLISTNLCLKLIAGIQSLMLGGVTGVWGDVVDARYLVIYDSRTILHACALGS